MDIVNKPDIVGHSFSEVVLFSDERKMVKDTTRFPFRWICSLEVVVPEPVLYSLATLENPGKRWLDVEPTMRGWGSGILVSPNHVLTSAHVVTGLRILSGDPMRRCKFRLVYATKVIVIPGRNEEDEADPRPFGTFVSRRLHVNPRFEQGVEREIRRVTARHITKKILPNDIAAVELGPRPVNGRSSASCPVRVTSWWGEDGEFSVRPAENIFKPGLRKVNMSIAGYPGEKGVVPCGAAWAAHENVVDIFPEIDGEVRDLVLYSADTSAGMSGSPVWLSCRANQRCLLGIHSSFLKLRETRSQKAITRNVATLITLDVITQLRTWGIRVGGDLNRTRRRKQ